MRIVFCFDGFNQTTVVLRYSVRIKPRKMCVFYKQSNKPESRWFGRRRIDGVAVDCEDDDDNDVIAEQTAAATKQVLQRARSVSPSICHQEPQRRLHDCTGRTEGGRDPGAAIRQLTE